MKLNETFQDYLAHLENFLEQVSSDKMFPDQPIVADSLRYSLLAGGKRIRPLLVFAVADSLGSKVDDPLIELAASIEMIHNYSLIHDDLPAMDNDQLRRGKPTNHIVYGEGMAILGGDALLNLAYENLFRICQKNPDLLSIARLISEAAGINGMVGGQSMDLKGSEYFQTAGTKPIETLENTETVPYVSNTENAETTVDDQESKNILIHQANHNKQKADSGLNYLKRLQALKTGALVKASVMTGYYYAQIQQSEDILFSLELEKLYEKYADLVGLEFQLRDDLLDFLSNTKKLGKSTGKDQRDHKLTFVTLLGLQEAENYDHFLINQIDTILDHLQFRELNVNLLRDLTNFLLNREY